MRMRLDIAAAALIVVWVGVSPLAAQKRSSAPPPRTAPPSGAHPPKAGANANPGKENPVEQLERFQKMPPEDREKALSKLPAERRARVEQQLANLDKLTPEQRARRIERLKTLQSLAPERRQAVQQEIQDLRSLPPRLRAARLNGDEMKMFSPVEQRLIRDTFPKAAKGPEEP